MKIWRQQSINKAVFLAFLFITGTGTTFAQDENITNPEICEGGFIEDVTVESINLDGVSCYFVGITVNKNLIVKNAGRITIQNSNVGGAIRVGASGDVDINDTNADRILVQGNERVEVSLVIADTQIRVLQNGSAFVAANASPSIECRGNTRLVGMKNQSSSGNNCSALTAPFWQE